MGNVHVIAGKNQVEVCDLLTGKYQPNQAYALPHMYTIPVAWEYVVTDNNVLDRKFVSILACECGKELKRDYTTLERRRGTDENI